MCEFYNDPFLRLLIPLVLVCVIFGLIHLIENFFERRKVKNCKHTQCEKTGESVTFDTELNRTETVTLKCLNCEKIIQVEK